MMLGQPDIIESGIFGPYDLIETSMIELGIILLPLRRVAKVVPQAKAKFFVAHNLILKLGVGLIVICVENESLRARQPTAVRSCAVLKGGAAAVR